MAAVKTKDKYTTVIETEGVDKHIKELGRANAAWVKFEKSAEGTMKGLERISKSFKPGTLFPDQDVANANKIYQRSVHLGEQIQGILESTKERGKYSKSEQKDLDNLIDKSLELRTEVEKFEETIEDSSDRTHFLADAMAQTDDVLKNINRDVIKFGKSFMTEEQIANIRKVEKETANLKEKITKLYSRKRGILDIEKVEELTKKIEEQERAYEAILAPVEELRKEYDNVSSAAARIVQQLASTEPKTNKEKKQRKEILKIVTKQKKELEKAAKTGKLELKRARDYSKTMGMIEEKLETSEQYQEMSYKTQKLEAQLSSMQNKALRDRLKSEEGGLATIGRRFKLWQQNIPNAAMAKFGGLAKAAGKAAQGLGKVLMSIPGLGAILGLAGFIFAMTEANKRIVTARKNILQMAAESGEWQRATLGAGKAIADDQSRLDGMRKQALALSYDLSTTTDEILEWEKGLVGAGFKLRETETNLKDVAAISTRVGMDFSELTSSFEEARVNLGGSLAEVKKGFLGLIGSSEDAGMNMSRFYSKVINASSGLGIYGTKLTSVGKLFGSLVKSMKMPEKEATEIAETMIQSWENMNTSQRAIVGESSEVGKIIKDNLNALSDGTLTLEKFSEMTGITDPKQLDEAYKRSQLIAQGAIETGNAWAGVSEIISMSDPAKRLQAQTEGFLKKLGLNVEEGSSKINEQFAKKIGSMSRQELAKLGENFGFGSEKAITGLRNQFETLAEKFPNVSFETGLKNLAKEQDKATKREGLNRLREMDKQIRKQTRPVTDAIEQGITKWLDRIYSFLMDVLFPIFNGVRKTFAKMFGTDEDYYNAMLTEQESIRGSAQDQIDSTKSSIEKLKATIETTSDPKEREKYEEQLVKEQTRLLAATGKLVTSNENIKNLQVNEGKLNKNQLKVLDRNFADQNKFAELNAKTQSRDENERKNALSKLEQYTKKQVISAGVGTQGLTYGASSGKTVTLPSRISTDVQKQIASKTSTALAPSTSDLAPVAAPVANIPNNAAAISNVAGNTDNSSKTTTVYQTNNVSTTVDSKTLNKHIGSFSYEAKKAGE
jgi:hypothetical protein